MSIILSGCGGGCDLLGGIPYFYKLKNLNEKNLILVNLSFTSEISLNILNKRNKIQRLSKTLYKVDARNIENTRENKKHLEYFPEYFISLYLKQPVYLILCFSSTISSITQDYNIIVHDTCKDLPLKSIYLFDGGCDALLSGRESDLATPVEDMMHIKAVQSFKVKKYVCAIGLTCDCASLPLEELHDRLTYLSKYLLEEEIWTLDDKNVERYYDFINNTEFNPTTTIVHSLICARLEGKSGRFIPKHLRTRISENKVNLDNLMVTFVRYNYEELIKDFAYLHRLEHDKSPRDIDKFIEEFRKTNYV